MPLVDATVHMPTSRDRCSSRPPTLHQQQPQEPDPFSARARFPHGPQVSQGIREKGGERERASVAFQGDLIASSARDIL